MKHKNTRKTHDGLDRSSITAFAVASQVAFGISASLVGGALLGWYLDQHVFHTSVPLATLIGLLLGLAAGVYGLIRLLSLLSESRGDSAGGCDPLDGPRWPASRA